jgi:ferredoxin--NADP+ reductase
VLRDLNRGDRPVAPIALNLRFGLTPQAVVEAADGTVLRVNDRDGVSHDLPADLIVTCIGYQTADVCSQPVTGGVFKNDDGLVADRLYAVGWCKRGPSGTIPTNRTEAATVAQRIAAEATCGGRDGSAALRGLLSDKGALVIDYAAWRRIDEQEQARAAPQRVRHKYSAINEMIQAAAPRTAVEPSL